jgi:hypothetical protein
MYAPAEHDEIETLANYLDQQLDALRAATLGLTEEQSRATPCRSTLSIAGLVKHVTYVMRVATDRLRGTPPRHGHDFVAEFAASFVPSPDEPTTALLARFDAARGDYLAAVRAGDPDAPTVEPPAPWYGRADEQPIRLRYFLVHQVEELARHAGHADIIREQLDGTAVPTLVMTLEGAPANQYFQPFEPAPGTIGAM